jgi:hypothetical protein
VRTEDQVKVALASDDESGLAPARKIGLGAQHAQLLGIREEEAQLGRAGLVGEQAELGHWYLGGLVLSAALFAWQQWLIRMRDREQCFRAFLNNNWVGLILFLGMALDLLFRER